MFTQVASSQGRTSRQVGVRLVTAALGMGGLLIANAAAAQPQQLRLPAGEIKAALPPGMQVVRGQTTASQILDGLVREALTSNLALELQRLTTRQSQSGVRQARGALLPTLAVDARYSEFSGVVNIGDFINPAYAALNQLLGQEAFPTNVATTLPFRQETRLRTTQVLFNQGAIEQWRLARALYGVSEAQQELAARQIAADVQQSWLALAGATRVVEVYESALAVLAENERVADRLVANGRGTADAVFRARADRADLAQQVADAERQRDAARRLLNALLDRDAETPIPVVDDSTLVRPLPGDREATMRAALARREELEQADLGVSIADRQVRLASSAFLPSVALAADWGIQGDRYRLDGSGNVAVASLVFQWNLFNGGQDAARREQATLEKRKAELRRRDAERQITVQVAQAWDAAQVAEGALETSAARLAAARSSFNLVSRRYDEGLAPHIEFVSARESLTQAELNAVLSRFTYAARRVDLERAAALRALTP